MTAGEFGRHVGSYVYLESNPLVRGHYCMKFWELISAFRSEKQIIEAALAKPQWTGYKGQYDDFDQLVNNQNRKILDADIPFDLAYDICSKSELVFWLNYRVVPNHLTCSKQNDDEKLERILPAEILVRFGGAAIEDALEYGSTYVTPRYLNGEIEVIGSYNLTNIGILAILRTENDLQLPGKHIYSTVSSNEWFVKSTPFMFVDPISAHLKMEAEKKQGIIHYIIKPVIGNEKPYPGELLKLKL